MAITQAKQGASELDFKDLMEYNMSTHRFVPKNELLKKYGVDIAVESGNENFNQAELRNISDTIYDYVMAHIPSSNKEIMLAKIAQNDNQEQETLARAFGYMAQFAKRGGDETSHQSGINFTTSLYIDPSVMDAISLGLQVQRMLKNGNGIEGSEIWHQGEYTYEVEDVTDLVFGVDY